MEFYNHMHNTLYLLSNRTGSSKMHAVCNHTAHLEHLADIRSAFDRLHIYPHIPVVIITRDPLERFLSGLTMVNTHVAPEKRNSPDYAEYFAYWVGAYRANFANYYAAGMFCPYDLGDPHVAHHLFRPLMLIAAGYNVEIIHLSEYTEHLIQHFPHCKQFIAASITGDRQREYREGLFASYQSVLGEGFDYKYSWSQWLAEEVKIYQLLEEYRAGNAKAKNALELFEQLVANEVYFSSIFSPNYFLATQLADFLANREPAFHQFKSHRLEKIDRIIDQVKQL